MARAEIVRGELDGMGHSARCEVLTWKDEAQSDTYAKLE